MANKTDARDIFDKVMDPENQIPAMGALYGAALGGLAARAISKRSKKFRKGDETVTPAEVVLVPAGATIGMALGQKTVENRKRAGVGSNSKRK